MINRWTWHGGGVRAAQAHFGIYERPWVDLSTGVNPRPWPIPPQDFDWASLPDEQDLRQLETAAADHFGVDPAFVCAVPGTEIGLRMIGSIMPGTAYHIAPSYRTHGEIFHESEPLSRAEHPRANGATLILANPNNPTGQFMERRELPSLLTARAPEGWLLIDEAFADTDPQLSVADQLDGGRRLILFRSFGKFFGLAGVRLGFILGPATLLASIRRKLGAWPLSAAAIAIGTQAYQDHGWIAATRQRLHQDAEALDAVLRASGLEPMGACPLFRLIETENAHYLFNHLAQQAILTRPFANNPHWLRIGLPQDDAGLARLAAALGHG